MSLVLYSYNENEERGRCWSRLGEPSSATLSAAGALTLDSTAEVWH